MRNSDSAMPAGARTWEFMKGGFRAFVPKDQERSAAVGVAAALVLALGGAALDRPAGGGTGSAADVRNAMAAPLGAPSDGHPSLPGTEFVAAEADASAGILRAFPDGSDGDCVSIKVPSLVEALAPAPAAAQQEPSAPAPFGPRPGAEPAGWSGDAFPIQLASHEVGEPDQWNAAELHPGVIRAVRAASRATGLDPAFLMAMASIESNFNQRASSGMSTAHGLFQHTRDGWLTAVRDFGEDHGLDWLVASITEQPDGSLTVKPRWHKHLMDLRENPGLSAMMAAETLRQGADVIASSTGRRATAADLYLDLVLGRAGVQRFLRALDQHPGASSASVIPGAVANNPRLFTRDGRVLPLGQAYVQVAGLVERKRSRYAEMFAIGPERLRSEIGAPERQQAHPALVVTSARSARNADRGTDNAAPGQALHARDDHPGEHRDEHHNERRERHNRGHDHDDREHGHHQDAHAMMARR